MTPTNKDIKVLGRVVSVAVDSIVVDASQVKDSTLNEFQDIINKRVRDKLDSFDHEIVIDGRSQGDETRINDNGISTFSLYATSGEFDTLTVDDSISADNISIDGNGSIGGDFSIGGNLTIDELVTKNIIVNPTLAREGITIDNGDATLILTADGIVGEDITLRGGINVADAVNADTIEASYAVNADVVNANDIKVLYHAPKEVSGEMTTVLNGFQTEGRYYFKNRMSLDGDPCEYGVFVDVMVERDVDDNSVIKVYQTLTTACKNNPLQTDLASYIYRTYNATTNQWTTVVEPGKTPFVTIS